MKKKDVLWEDCVRRSVSALVECVIRGGKVFIIVGSVVKTTYDLKKTVITINTATEICNVIAFDNSKVFAKTPEVGAFAAFIGWINTPKAGTYLVCVDYVPVCSDSEAPVTWEDMNSEYQDDNIIQLNDDFKFPIPKKCNNCMDIYDHFSKKCRECVY